MPHAPHLTHSIPQQPGNSNTSSCSPVNGILDLMTVQSLLQSIPPVAVYLIVGAVIGIESLGIPLPGEIALVSAALLASRHTLDISPVWVGVAATLGAVIGDTIGYSIGRQYGMSLFERLGKRFPSTSAQAMSRWPNSCSRAGECGRSSSAASLRCCASSRARSPVRCGCGIQNFWPPTLLED